MSCLHGLRSVTMVEMVCSEAVSDAVLHLTQKLVFQDAWVFVALFPS
jgi:hypothetical protein